MNLSMLRNRELKRLLMASSIWFLFVLSTCLFIESKMGTAILLIVLFSGWTVMLWLAFCSVYQGIRQVSQGADHLMRGEYDIRFPDDAEGDLSILGHQFNQLSVRLQLSMEQLQMEQERLKRLISDVSHQFKTPLSSLLLFQELLSDPSASEQDRKQLLERSRKELHRMERLIQSLLTMSRLEAGVIEVRPVSSDLAATVRERLGSLDSLIRQKHLSVRQEGAEAPIPFVHDPFWVSEALGNILHNAIDFTPEEGQIAVAVYRTGMSLQIAIRDSGVGIAEDDLPHIFARFYQGKQARLFGRGGTGIGLALARLIIEKHGGYIHAESTLGKGTSVIMTFPVPSEAYNNVSGGFTVS